MEENNEFNYVQTSSLIKTRDHWGLEVLALDLLNGEDQLSAQSEGALADRFLLFDKPKVLDS